MATEDKVFAGSVPAIYEKFMVPMIFQSYAEEVADRLEHLHPKDILEVAAGTGVLTRAMAAHFGAKTKIVATDLNQPMLDIAMDSQRDDSRITWKQADALDLPFEDQSFDAVACQFGVMFFPDKVKAYREAYRVLKPDGRYILSAWDKLGSNEFVVVVSETLSAMFPSDPPRFMERTPHGYYNLDEIGAELKAAGFGSVNFETVDHIGHANSALDAATGYCQGTPLRGEIDARAPGELALVTSKVAEALERQFGKGPISGRIRAHIATAVR